MKKVKRRTVSSHVPAVLNTQSGKELKSSTRTIRLNKSQLDKLTMLTDKERSDFLSDLFQSDQLSQTDIANRLADHYNLQKLDLSTFEPDSEIISSIPRRVCEQHNLLPLMLVGDTIIVACSDPGNREAKESISMLTNYKVELVVAEHDAIKKMIQRYHVGDTKKIKKIFSIIESSKLGAAGEKAGDAVDLMEIQNDPIVQSVNFIFDEGMRLNCSDIHIEVYENIFRVRYRVDGKLYEGITPPLNSAQAISSRVKVMSKLNISEKRLPQDGRLKIKHKNRVIDFRVSSIPVMSGEKIVMRILDSSSLMTDVSELGMNPEQAQLFNKYLNLSQGFILITGPTGSGKTTTIYSGLMELNKPTVNISTAEDPVEYKLPGINQLQVNPKIGLTFSSALKSFLRQDPDIILVGEIRDVETAEMAFRAAATGHLVLSTLHTTDSASTVTRLLDMGLPSYSVAENISIIIAQRLLRLLCSICKAPDKVPPSALMQLGFTEEKAKDSSNNIMKPVGCGQCNHSGYAGRIAVYEILEMSGALKTAIFKNPSPRELKQKAIEEANLKTLRQSSLGKLSSGMTSVDEIIYGTMEDN